MRNHHGFDLFDQNSLASGDHNAIARLKVEKTMLLTELYDFVAKNLVVFLLQYSTFFLTLFLGLENNSVSIVGI